MFELILLQGRIPTGRNEAGVSCLILAICLWVLNLRQIKAKFGNYMSIVHLRSQPLQQNIHWDSVFCTLAKKKKMLHLNGFGFKNLSFDFSVILPTITCFQSVEYWIDKAIGIFTIICIFVKLYNVLFALAFLKSIFFFPESLLILALKM